MWERCPPRYVRRDLEILAPAVVVTIGQRVGDAVGTLLDVCWDDAHIPALRRGAGRLNGDAVQVLACNHPSYGHWRASTPAPATSLRHQAVDLG